jgi:hypothetical protein
MEASIAFKTNCPPSQTSSVSTQQITVEDPGRKRN